MSDLRNATLDSVIDPTDHVDHQGLPLATPPHCATDGDWDAWAIAYLLVEIHRLNTVLKPHIVNPRDREDVLVEYLHGFVDLLEMGAIKRPDRTDLPVVFPQLTFAEKCYSADDGTGATRRVHLAPMYTPLEEYVGGLISEYFTEMNETLDAEMVLHTE